MTIRTINRVVGARAAFVAGSVAMTFGTYKAFDFASASSMAMASSSSFLAASSPTAPLLRAGSQALATLLDRDCVTRDGDRRGVAAVTAAAVALHAALAVWCIACLRSGPASQLQVPAVAGPGKHNLWEMSWSWN